MTRREMPATVLLVEDDPANRASVTMVLRNEGYQVIEAQDGLKAVDCLRKEAIDIILTDLRMPAMDGLDLQRAVNKLAPDIPVIVMTAHGTIETAVQAIKQGAYDFITKPFKKATLVRTLEKCLEHRRLLTENRLLKQELQQYRDERKLIGHSPAIRHILDMIKQVAPSCSTVLLHGESGTGKEILAQMIHNQSLRKNNPFVTISCAAIPESLLEAELFGYERGAFTGAQQTRRGRFETAHTGTLFLDEIGEIPLSVQVKLLRVLQNAEFERLGSSQTIKCDVRLIAATHRNLTEAIAEGTFREDLYYRLNVIKIQIPPLRSRQEDIPTLAIHFLRKFARQNNKTLQGFDQKVLDILMHYTWPGNVRELENVMEHAVVLSKSPLITCADLPDAIVAGPRWQGDRLAIPIGTPIKDIERLVIQETLKHTQGDKRLAAQLLGIAERTIYRKLEEL